MTRLALVLLLLSGCARLPANYVRCDCPPAPLHCVSVYRTTHGVEFDRCERLTPGPR